MCRFSKIHTLREWTIVDQCEVSNFSATSWKEEVVFRWDCVHFPIFCHWAYLMKIILKVISEMCCCTKLDIYVFIVLDLHTKMQSLFQKVISCKSQYHFYSWFLRMFLVFFFIAYVVKFLTPEIELHRRWGLHLCKLEYMYQNDKKNNITAKFGSIRLNRFAGKEIINDDIQQTSSTVIILKVHLGL